MKRVLELRITNVESKTAFIPNDDSEGQSVALFEYLHTRARTVGRFH